ncbi:hypothetical protein HF086_005389 [Spodoptera exigua]|uniref:Uncharacterized protein n=1 Tax=Spodoptera exigua TaxID=7107 RepID=A0A922M2I7_SPOEX|nr:hypothetical protein HF086_005389 [Spodoptera exigua]
MGDKNSDDADNNLLRTEENSEMSKKSPEGIISAKNSDGDTQNNSGVSQTQYVSKQLSNKDSGDAGEDMSSKNSKILEEENINLIETSKDYHMSGDGKGSGSNTAIDSVTKDQNLEKSSNTPPEEETDDGLEKLKESTNKMSQDSDDKYEVDEDEMELKWDDDEVMDPIEGIDSGRYSPKNEDLLEEQLLADPTDTTVESKVLDEPNKNPDSKSTFENAEIENDLLEDSVHSDLEADTVLKECQDVIDEKDNLCEDTEMTEIEKTEKITKNNTKKSLEEAKEDELFMESKNPKQTGKSAFEITSFTDIVMDTDDDKVKQGKKDEDLLKNQDMKDKKLDDEALLEDQLLAETDIPELVPDTDSMDAVDDDKERELLKEDGESQSATDLKTVQNTEDEIGNINKDEDAVLDQDKEINTETEKAEDPAKVSESIDQTVIDIDLIGDANKNSDFDKEKQNNIFEEAALNESDKKTITVDDNVDGNVKENLVESTEKSNLTPEQIQTDPELPSPGQMEETSNNKEPAVNEDKTENLVTNVEKEEKSPKQDLDLDKTATADDISLCEAASSPAPIKTNHRLNKPDAMLEIPTQELLNIDDLSFGLDRSDSTDSPDDDDEQDTSVTAPVKEPPAPVREECNVTEGMNRRGNMVPNESIEDSLEKMFADHAPIVIPVEQPVYVADASSQSDLGIPLSFLPGTASVASTSTAVSLETTANSVTETATPTPTDTTTANDAPTTTDPGPANEMTPDTSNGVPEVSDSLGLLAESSGRVMEDDEEPEDDDDGDDDEDFDQDESSNQVSAEQSEDSNPPASEHEPAKDQDGKDLDTPEPKDEQFTFSAADPPNAEEKMDVDNENCEFGTLEIHAETIQEDDSNAEAHAVRALEDGPGEQIEQQKVTSDQMDIETVKLSDTSDNEAEDTASDVRNQTTEEIKQTEVQRTSESDVTDVNIPTGIEIMCTSAGNTSEIVTKEGEVVISGVPKPPPHKVARLNTSEVSIKTASNTEPMVIPVTQITEQQQTSTDPKPKIEKTPDPPPEAPSDPEKPRRCVNDRCPSGPDVAFLPASTAVVAYYDAPRKKKHLKLVEGIKNFTPLLELDMSKNSHDLVKISDSESDDEDQSPEEEREFLEDNLANYFNETWKKYNMDARLKETQTMLDEEINKLEKDSKEIDAMLNECQAATDKLRTELYATFECRRQELTPLVLFDMPNLKLKSRQAKRRNSSSNDLPPKKPAIALGYTPLEQEQPKKDISVVKLSAESAPADLPPPGEISRPPLRISMPVYAMKNAFGPWLKGRILEILPKNSAGGNMFSLCRVKFDHKAKAGGKILPARCIAYLVFFDDGYAQYVQHQHTRLVCESSPLVWEEVHPFSREFVREYLLAYPERPMVRLHEGQNLKTEWNVAKKSTAVPNVLPPQQVASNNDAVTSRVVYYTPKNAVKPYKMVPHKCSPKCKRSDVLTLKELRTYNPLAKPLLSGWERAQGSHVPRAMRAPPAQSERAAPVPARDGLGPAGRPVRFPARDTLPRRVCA